MYGLSMCALTASPRLGLKHRPIFVGWSADGDAETRVGSTLPTPTINPLCNEKQHGAAKHCAHRNECNRHGP